MPDGRDRFADGHTNPPSTLYFNYVLVIWCENNGHWLGIPKFVLR